jgi:hypothetical protein
MSEQSERMLRAAMKDQYRDMQAEIERLRLALKKVGDDYPGSSCQQWCYEQARIPLSASPTVPHWYCAECRGQAMTSDGPIIHAATCNRR